MVKNPPAIWETWIQSLGWKDPLEEGMTTHSSILAWRIPMDRGAWWATVHRVSKSQTWLQLSRGHRTRESTVTHSLLNSQWPAEWTEHGESGVCSTKIEVNYTGRLQSMESLRVRHNWATSLSLFTFMHWRRKWQPTPVFLPGQSQGQGSLVGCCLWGLTESDTTEAT